MGAQKATKRFQGQLRDVNTACEEEQRSRQEVAEKASLADRRSHALAAELEEARALHSTTDRGKRQTESELAEARSAVIEMTSINSKANSDKRAIEGAVHTMHAEVDEILQQAKGSEDKSKKAMVDAARLADELRAEQDHTNSLSKAKRTLETQLNDLEAKFQDANENAIRGGHCHGKAGEPHPRVGGGAGQPAVQDCREPEGLPEVRAACQGGALPE